MRQTGEGDRRTLGMSCLRTVPYFSGTGSQKDIRSLRERTCGSRSTWSLREEGSEFCFLILRELGVGGFAIVISCHRKWGWWVQKQHPAPSLSQIRGEPPYTPVLPLLPPL